MSESVTCIRRADWVVAWDAAKARHVYLRHADVAFQAGGLVHVGPGYGGPVADELDGAGRMVMPGLVDVHSHPASEPLDRGYNEELHVFTWQVSGRGRRMAAFARALSRDPELVIVDRFFEGLEMPDWRRLFELVMELNQHQGVTWLLVSEQDPAIFQVAERAAVLEGGRLLGYDTRRRLCQENARIRAAFEAAEVEDRPQSSRILLVESSAELDAVRARFPAWRRAA